MFPFLPQLPPTPEELSEHPLTPVLSHLFKQVGQTYQQMRTWDNLSQLLFTNKINGYINSAGMSQGIAPYMPVYSMNWNPHFNSSLEEQFNQRRKRSGIQRKIRLVPNSIGGGVQAIYAERTVFFQGDGGQEQEDEAEEAEEDENHQEKDQGIVNIDSDEPGIENTPENIKTPTPPQSKNYNSIFEDTQDVNTLNEGAPKAQENPSRVQGLSTRFMESVSLKKKETKDPELAGSMAGSGNPERLGPSRDIDRGALLGGSEELRGRLGSFQVNDQGLLGGKKSKSIKPEDSYSLEFEDSTLSNLNKSFVEEANEEEEAEESSYRGSKYQDGEEEGYEEYSEDPGEPTRPKMRWKDDKCRPKTRMCPQNRCKRGDKYRIAQYEYMTRNWECHEEVPLCWRSPRGCRLIRTDLETYPAKGKRDKFETVGTNTEDPPEGSSEEDSDEVEEEEGGGGRARFSSQDTQTDGEDWRGGTRGINTPNSSIDQPNGASTGISEARQAYLERKKKAEEHCQKSQEIFTGRSAKSPEVKRNNEEYYEDHNEDFYYEEDPEFTPDLKSRKKSLSKSIKSRGFGAESLKSDQKSIKSLPSKSPEPSMKSFKSRSSKGPSNYASSKAGSSKWNPQGSSKPSERVGTSRRKDSVAGSRFPPQDNDDSLNYQVQDDEGEGDFVDYPEATPPPPPKKKSDASSKSVKFKNLNKIDLESYKDLEKLEEESNIKKLEDFNRKKPPVIWILGLPQKEMGAERIKYCLQLAEALHFTYINMDEVIGSWAKEEVSSARRKKAPQFLRNMMEKWRGSKGKDKGKIGQIAKDITKNPDEWIPRQGIALLLRWALLETFPDSMGYVVDSFPLNEPESRDFIETIYYPAAAFYFLSNGWTLSKEVEPEVSYPKLFRRDQPYYEAEVESLVDTLLDIGIKVLNASQITSKKAHVLTNAAIVLVNKYAKELKEDEGEDGPGLTLIETDHVLKPKEEKRKSGTKDPKLQERRWSTRAHLSD